MVLVQGKELTNPMITVQQHCTMARALLEGTEEKSVCIGWYRTVFIILTPLHKAAKEGNWEICIIMMDGFEDKSQAWGPSFLRPQTPLEIAKRKGHVTLFKNWQPRAGRRSKRG